MSAYGLCKHCDCDGDCVIERIVASAVEAERKACARVADDLSKQYDMEFGKCEGPHCADACDEVAQAIRARSSSGKNVPTMTPIDQMTDAEIVAAVRRGDVALVPVAIGSHVAVGEITLPDLDGIIGKTGLVIRLSRDECRFVAPQVIR